MNRIFSILFLLTTLNINAQEVNYFEHVKPILNKHCVVCHQNGGAGPFSLASFEDVEKRGKFILKVTQSKYMPPFPADKKFQHYKNERGLTNGEIGTIRLWVEAGMPKGDEEKDVVKTKPKEVKSEPDLKLSMKNNYEIKGNNQEDFRFFSIPTELQSNQYITDIEFEAGNKLLVHHSRLMVDTTNLIRGIDGMSELDQAIKPFQIVRLKDEFLWGWVPGNDKISFPKGFGRKLNMGSDILLNMHYAPSPKSDTDRSSFGFYFAKEPIKREVNVMVIRENDISNQPFEIKANETKTFFSSVKVEKDLSLISVLPHMHLLGKSFRAFAVTSDGDVINLVKIDRWDINWQMTYQFKKLIKIPAGSLLMVEAVYDNTTANPENPNSPPKDVTYGWGTKEEMMNFVLYYADYKAGDENIEQ